MDDAKKRRSNKGRTATRRINELSTAIKDELPIEELEEKGKKLRIAMEELGVAHDEVLDQVTSEKDEEIDQLENWYYDYNQRANIAIRSLAKIKNKSNESKESTFREAKVEKLKLPKFDSSPKLYFKWKKTFERYLKQFDDETKYDYLLTHTLGEAHEYVSNKGTYMEAIEKLDEKFGNKHYIMKLLLEDIKSTSIAKVGDFSSFEKLSFQVTNFRDRLIEMGLNGEVENLKP